MGTLQDTETGGEGAEAAHGVPPGAMQVARPRSPAAEKLVNFAQCHLAGRGSHPMAETTHSRGNRITTAWNGCHRNDSVPIFS